MNDLVMTQMTYFNCCIGVLTLTTTVTGSGLARISGVIAPTIPDEPSVILRRDTSADGVTLHNLSCTEFAISWVTCDDGSPSVLVVVEVQTVVLAAGCSVIDAGGPISKSGNFSNSVSEFTGVNALDGEYGAVDE